MNNRRIGNFTLSLGLIGLGVLLLLYLSEIVSLDALKFFAPALLILFGLEIVLSYFRPASEKGDKMKLNIGAIVLVVIALGYTVAWQPKYFSPVSGQMVVSSEVVKVDIKLPDSRIEVVGVPGNRLVYHGELKVSGSSQQDADEHLQRYWVVEQKGSTLEMRLDVPRRFSLVDFPFKSGFIEIEVPQDLIVQTKTTNGHIQVENIDADVILTTSNGRVEASQIAGNAEVKTSNGSINVSQVKGDLQATTSNGEVNLTEITGIVTARSSNGNIEVTSAIEGNWKLRTSNGRITMNVPHNTDATIEASTSNGSFNGNVAWIDEGRKKRSSVLGAGTYDVEMTTSNGRITVNQR